MVVTKPKLTPPEMLRGGQTAVDYAVSVRTYHAKRTKRGSQQREDDIKIALERLRSAMKPIRSEIASWPFRTVVKEREALEAMSKAIQRERRKLWKMRSR